MKSYDEVWIESVNYGRGKGLVLKIGSAWGCDAGFDKETAKKFFDGIKKMAQEILPNAKINPWSDDEPGTADFE